MKNRSKISIFLVCIVAIVCMVGLASCTDGSKKGKAYTITYMEGETAKTISVEKGGSFSLSPVPTKEGYTFQGLFDGADKQYINKDGLGLFAYDLDSDLTLIIKWAPIECQLILDYSGGKVEGTRSFKILYGENVTALPTTTKENYVFTGWFTQPNCKGVQIADEFGILPLKEVFTSATYEIENGISTIYAGFDIIKHSVKFYFGTDVAAESQVVQAAHGSKLGDITPEKLIKGFAVLTWSTVKDGTAIFNGEILADMTLYAVEFAPQISFNCSGGAALKAIVAKEGSPIVLPNAVRENYVFSNWLDEKGVAQDFATMPSKSMTLTANWKPMVIFDENGGSSVKDLTLNKGDAITLPSPTKSDMIFDAWYTENDVKFVGANIGKESVKLKAKYFKIIRKTIIMATKPRSVGG
ncbi:MAG: InlB B-repeat-containing protein, partial [Clostridia bacterium]